jgi:hypothetical protein
MKPTGDGETGFDSEHLAGAMQPDRWRHARAALLVDGKSNLNLQPL